MKINALVTEVGVPMGDHHETTVTAVDVDPSMRVEELVQRTLGDFRSLFSDYDENGKRVFYGNPNKSITLRVAMPITGGK